MKTNGCIFNSLMILRENSFGTKPFYKDEKIHLNGDISQSEMKHFINYARENKIGWYITANNYKLILHVYKYD